MVFFSSVKQHPLHRKEAPSTDEEAFLLLAESSPASAERYVLRKQGKVYICGGMVPFLSQPVTMAQEGGVNLHS